MKGICSLRRSESRRPPGFTLVELLIVIVVIAMLAALLIPAIAGAVNKAKEAAVASELNLLSTALMNFRNQYGELPPSRILLCEDGNYSQYLSAAMASDYRFATPSAQDISTAQLAQRSLLCLRKFWPRLNLASVTATVYPDFNGNGTQDPPYVLSGDECLVWFLGGVPRVIQTKDSSGKVIRSGWGMLGTAANPMNPFPSVNPLAVSRSKPLYDFKPSLLIDGDGDGMPSYVDSHTGDRPIAYFLSYGGVYDPNDCNFDKGSPFAESDSDEAVSPPTLSFRVPYPTRKAVGGLYYAVSPAPNPYTTTPASAGAVLWERPSTFQLIASGRDGRYGLGGEYHSDMTAPLPLESTAGAYNTTDGRIRQREDDNITNFHASRLN